MSPDRAARQRPTHPLPRAVLTFITMMNRISTRMKNLSAIALLACVLCPAVGAQKLQYPATKKVEQYDTYFGVKVADPYRWLEDEGSPETARWVEEQNKVTFAYLEKIPYRAQVK